MLVEFRCEKCGRLLGRVEGKAEIKCKRCYKMNYIDTKEE